MLIAILFLRQYICSFSNKYERNYKYYNINIEILITIFRFDVMTIVFIP